MAKHAFHVINVTLIGSRGTSSANSFRPVLPKCQVHVLHGFAKIQIWDRVSIEKHDERTFPKEQSRLLQHLPAVPLNDTNVSLSHIQRDCLSASASRPDFLSFKPRQEDEERGSRGHLSVHHPNSRNFSRFRLPVLQIQLSEQNFFQRQAHADSFIIAVCCCLSLCCK